MKENKKKLGVIVISLVLMIGLVIGLTYAAFTYTSSGTQENVVSTTAVTMKYTEKTNGILLDNAMPIDDETGKSLALDSNYAFYFTVSIVTGSATPVGFEVTAEKLTAKELFDNNQTDEDKEADVELVKDDEVKLYLERSENNPDNYQSIMEPTIYTPLTTATPLGAQVGEMMLDFGTVSETKTYHYILRMWLGDNYEVDNIERYYGVRVNVYGTDSRSYSNTLTLNKNSLELEIDETEQLTTIVTPDNVTNADITWSSSDSTIAKVDTMGNVTGVSTGNATITATTSKGRKATCTITIKGKSPQSIAIKENDATLENITLITENSKIINASVTPNDYDDSTYSITWTTSDSDVVDIEEVTDNATGTSSNDETIIASKMASKNITAKKVKLVAGSTPGEATITATTKNKEGKDVSTSFIVTVEYPNANSVTLDTTKATMDIGDSTTLTVTINPTNVKNDEIVWTSNNSSVIDVSSCSGKSCTVEGLSDGEVSITATIKDTDISATSTITIQKPEITTIEMSSDISTYKGKTATFTLNITPSEVRNQDEIRWKSDDTAVATIPESCSGSLSCSPTIISDGTSTIKAVVVKIKNGEEVETSILDTAKLTVNINTVNFKSYIESLYKKGDSTLFYDGTSDNNLRYSGANPNNYVGFNNERWRIIGIFGNNVKIVRNSSLGEYSFDNGVADYGSGNWKRPATLKTTLNTAYWGSKNTKCGSGTTIGATIDCDFSSSGLSSVQSYVDNHTWNIGGYSNYAITAAESLIKEKTTTDTMNVGLISPSELGYASSGCKDGSKTLDKYRDTSCASSNWLAQSPFNVNKWSISPWTGNSQGVIIIHFYGMLDRNSAVYNNAVFPAVYLKSNVIVKEDGADGSYDKPYNIELGS